MKEKDENEEIKREETAYADDTALEFEHTGESQIEAVESQPETSDDEREQSVRDKGKVNPVKKFFAQWGGLIALCACITLIVVMAVIGFALGGDIYDKVAMLWIVSFIAEFAYTFLYSRKPKALVVMILTAAMAVAFVVLYGLEVGGILP